MVTEKINTEEAAKIALALGAVYFNRLDNYRKVIWFYNENFAVLLYNLESQKLFTPSVTNIQVRQPYKHITELLTQQESVNT